MEELETRLTKLVTKRQDRHRKRQKTCYQLAKDYGFSANEAAVLQNWSEADIHRLACERGYPPVRVK